MSSINSIPKKHTGEKAIILNEKAIGSLYNEDIDYVYSTVFVDEYNPNGLRQPTPDENKSLRKVLCRLLYPSYLICLAELAERASYYSVTAVLTNWIQRPMPHGSKTGAPISDSLSESAGALDMGLQTASALTLLLTFLAYLVPLYGGFIADAKLGKLKAIWIGVFAGFISHVLFVIAAIPAVISKGHAIVPTVFGIITIAFGTGFIKPNLLPLLMDQYPYETDLVKVLPSGELVILDRQKSLQRITLVFYWAINIGAFFQLAASYAERRIGFWLAFFFPTVIYMFLPFIFYYLHKKLVVKNPSETIISNSWKIANVSLRGNWLRRIRDGTFWEYAKPSKMMERGELFYKEKKKSPITWDDPWVLDIKQTVNSCKIFLYYPIFLINDGGIGSIQTSQAGSMTTEGVPNDLFNNFNPLTIIILIPILDTIVYPTLRRFNIEFRPIQRIFFGFILAAISQVAGAVIQYQVYQTSPCGYYATNCENVSPLSAWKDVSLYVLQASGECFAMTTGYELAYTRSPESMKGLVMAIFLFMSAISAAISEALTSTLVDPHLIWPFSAMGIIGFVTAFIFFFHFRNLHKVMEEERISRESQLMIDKQNQD